MSFLFACFLSWNESPFSSINRIRISLSLTSNHSIASLWKCNKLHTIFYNIPISLCIDASFGLYLVDPGLGLDSKLHFNPWSILRSKMDYVFMLDPQHMSNNKDSKKQTMPVHISLRLGINGPLSSQRIMDPKSDIIKI